MINVDLGKHRRLSVMFDIKNVFMGPRTNRTTVTCDVYSQHDSKSPLGFVNRGVAILNPLDTFNEKVGMHKALASALYGVVDDYGRLLEADDKRKIHDVIDGWVQ